MPLNWPIITRVSAIPFELPQLVDAYKKLIKMYFCNSVRCTVHANCIHIILYQYNIWISNFICVGCSVIFTRLNQCARVSADHNCSSHDNDDDSADWPSCGVGVEIRLWQDWMPCAPCYSLASRCFAHDNGREGWKWATGWEWARLCCLVVSVLIALALNWILTTGTHAKQKTPGHYHPSKMYCVRSKSLNTIVIVIPR